jgi:two-component system, cell cycle sensor histidine kinase and response regulator CckA
MIIENRTLPALIKSPITLDRAHVAMDVGAIALTGAGLFWLLTHYLSFLQRAYEHNFQKEQVFRMLVSNVRDIALILLDSDGCIVAWNEGAARMFHYLDSDAVGQTHAMLYSPEEDGEGEPDQQLGKARKSGRFQTQGWRRRKNGSLFRAEISLTPIFDEDGALKGYSQAIRDLTASTEAHEQVQQLFHILDAAKEFIIIRDLDGTIRYVNKGAQTVLGMTSTEIVGRNIRDLVYTGSEDFDITTRELVQGGQWRGELDFVSKAGSRKVLMSQVTVVPHHPTTVLSIATDVTEHRHMEQQMLRSQRLEMIGTLTSGIAHDLNNVLSPVVMAAQMFTPNKSEEELERLREVLMKGTGRAVDVVRQLLSFSRGQQEAKTNLQPRALIKEILGLVRETFPRGVKVQDSVPEDLSPIWGNATQLHQVIMNLCVNARDAMPQGGTIEVRGSNTRITEEFCQAHRTAKSGNFVKIVIADTGTGIPAEMVQEVWKPFFTTKTEGKGTGLGLPTVKRLVEEHAGFVLMTSTIGKGTTFELYFPVAEMAPSH